MTERARTGITELHEARRMLAHLGRPSRAHIASGMEGHVFDIGNERVAKVWHGKGVGEVVQIQSFYELLHGLHLPFATPMIDDVHQVSGTTISIERKVHGTPLIDLVSPDELLSSFAIDAVVFVLAALRERPVTNAHHALPILGVAPSNQIAMVDSAAFLIDVLGERVNRHGDQLRASVQDFDVILDQTIRHVRAFADTSPRRVVHGDLCPPNILLDSDLQVSAVVDWGFLSLTGDPALDASITCGICDMYGPHSRQNDDLLTAECENRLGHDRQRMLVYRALYAMLTSNAYTGDGIDGHFAWCVQTLNRPDIREAIVS